MARRLPNVEGVSPRMTLADLHEGDRAALRAIELEQDLARRLMELGFVPGAIVTAGRSAPGGDPRVYRVDGAEIALRRETANRIRLVVPAEP